MFVNNEQIFRKTSTWLCRYRISQTIKVAFQKEHWNRPIQCSYHNSRCNQWDISWQTMPRAWFRVLSRSQTVWNTYFLSKNFTRTITIYRQPYLTSYRNKKSYSTWCSIEKKRKFFLRKNYIIWNIFFFQTPLKKEESKLSGEVRNIGLIDKFKSTALNLIRPIENSDLSIHDINSVKVLTCLRLNFSHLNEHKLWHRFYVFMLRRTRNRSSLPLEL